MILPRNSTKLCFLPASGGLNLLDPWSTLRPRHPFTAARAQVDPTVAQDLPGRQALTSARRVLGDRNGDSKSPFIDGLPIKNGDFPWLC